MQCVWHSQKNLCFATARTRVQSPSFRTTQLSTLPGQVSEHLLGVNLPWISVPSTGVKDSHPLNSTAGDKRWLHGPLGSKKIQPARYQSLLNAKVHSGFQSNKKSRSNINFSHFKIASCSLCHMNTERTSIQNIVLVS